MARILVYCQSLQGVGHYVRSWQIVQALAADHDVWFVNGGKAIVQAHPPERVRLIQLPEIHVSAGTLTPAGSAAALGEILEQRRIYLQSILSKARPDAVMIEHFPFGKLAFRDEIIELIEVALAMNSAVEVICSVRDYPISKEMFDRSPEQQEVLIGSVLASCFKRMLVHADPKVCRIEDQFPWLTGLGIPIHTTGYVSQPIRPVTDLSQTIVVSSGGLGDGGELARWSREAWSILAARGESGFDRMVLFTSPDCSESLRSLATGAATVEIIDAASIEQRSFGDDFLDLLPSAALSISLGGYNTSTNVLAVRVPSIMVPSPRVQDQELRARRLEQLGLTTVIDRAELNGERLAEAMVAAPIGRLQEHGIDLDGARATAELIGALLG